METIREDTNGWFNAFLPVAAGDGVIERHIISSEINIAIGYKAPEKYFHELLSQCNGGEKSYGGISSEIDLRSNLEMNCRPVLVLENGCVSYDDFLAERRRLMAFIFWLILSKY